LKQKFVFSLGSLHLTLMAAVGIWLWSSPIQFEMSQHEFPQSLDQLPLYCTATTILGRSIKLTSLGLQRWSLIIYSCFLIPGLNLLIPAILFLALHIGFHGWRPLSKYPKTLRPHIAPVSVGLVFLLAINVVFLVDVEITISQARQGQQQRDESEWTFGQTLALLLLSLPIRDLLEYVLRTQEMKHREKCTASIKQAIEAHDLPTVQKLAKVRKLAKQADLRVVAQCALQGTFSDPSQN
jgi:hypothetical protein